VEPYVTAADIYGAAPHTGQGGWTWYTGSAGWMYRLIIDCVFGLELRANQLTFKPRLPPAWEECLLHYRFRETVYHIRYRQPTAGEKPRVMVDGEEQTDHSVTLNDDRLEHSVEIVMET
jgi:cyclic beta-1,2-glucan synthetase